MPPQDPLAWSRRGGPTITCRRRHIVKRVGFILKVKAELIAEYKRHHQAVWPEMLEALRRHGWHNYSLFMREDGTIFGYVETANGLEAAVAGMSNEPVNARWQAFMAPYFEALSHSRPDESMAQIEEIFHLQ